MLILQKVSEEKEFRERDRLKLENEQKEVGGTSVALHCWKQGCVLLLHRKLSVIFRLITVIVITAASQRATTIYNNVIGVPQRVGENGFEFQSACRIL